MSISIDPSEITISADRCEESLNIRASWQGHQVGYAFCEIQPRNRIEICDFKVEEAFSTVWSYRYQFLCWLGLRPQTINFRGRGVGSRMMKCLVDKASRLGVREIWGAVTLGDATATPTLLGWYGKFGFRVADRDEECRNKDAGWKVRLDLPRPHED